MIRLGRRPSVALAALACAAPATLGCCAPPLSSGNRPLDEVCDLTDGQKWRVAAAVRIMKSIYGPLKLTGEQVARIGECHDELRQDTKLSRNELMTLLAARIRTDILTARQRHRYAKATKPGPHGTKRL